MHRLLPVALLLLVALPARAQTDDPPAARARYDSAYVAWQDGDYPAALGGFARLMRSADAGRFRARVALLTGERYRTVEVAPDGARMQWSRDGRRAAYTTDGGRTSHIVDLDGGRGAAARAPRGRRPHVLARRAARRVPRRHRVGGTARGAGAGRFAAPRAGLRALRTGDAARRAARTGGRARRRARPRLRARDGDAGRRSRQALARVRSRRRNALPRRRPAWRAGTLGRVRAHFRRAPGAHRRAGPQDRPPRGRDRASPRLLRGSGHRGGARPRLGRRPGLRGHRTRALRRRHRARVRRARRG